MPILEAMLPSIGFSSMLKSISCVALKRPSVRFTVTVASFGRSLNSFQLPARLMSPLSASMLNKPALSPDRLQRTMSPSGSFEPRTLTTRSLAFLSFVISAGTQSIGAIISGARFGSPKVSVSVSSSVASPSDNWTVISAEHSSGPAGSTSSSSSTPPPSLEAVVITRIKSPILAVRDRKCSTRRSTGSIQAISLPFSNASLFCW